MTAETTAPTPDTALAGAAARPAGSRRVVVVLGGVALLLGLAALSMYVGSGDISSARITQVLTQWLSGSLPAGDRDTTELLILDRRLPRTVLAVVVGAALGVAGVLMQAMTRNPLADPGLLGVNAGAYAAVVFGSAVLGISLGAAHVWLAIGGALVTAVAVYLIGSTGRAGGTGAKLVLTGVALGALLTGLSYAVTLAVPEVFDRVRFWSAGSLQGRSWEELSTVAPFIVVGLLLAVLLPRGLNALSLGEDAAVALGAKPLRTRITGLAAVTLLCGAATAAAGPLSFIGLMVPHALRMLAGPDHRWLVPLSLLAAPVLMLTADILARVIVAAELPAGVVTAFLGAPVLIWLTRRRAVKQL